MQVRLVVEDQLIDTYLLTSTLLQPARQQVVALLGLDSVVARTNRDVGHSIGAPPEARVARVNEAHDDRHDTVVEYHLFQLVSISQ